jgi:predicted RNA-binding Zn-ribbon protein involved in translation (DUF1610 family)
VAEDDKLPEPQNQHQELRCPTCGSLVHRVLDPRTGKTFHLYRCECVQSAWKE